MSAFCLSGILIATTGFGLGVLVLIRSTDKHMSRLWFLFSLTTTFWGLGIVLVGLNPGLETSLLAWRMAYALGVIWISPVFYHFTCLFLGQKAKKSNFINYAIAGVLILFIPSKLFFAKIEFLFGEFFYIRGGAIYHWFMIWWTGLVVFSHIKLVRAFKTASPAKRNQIKYFFLATAIGYSGGFQTYLPKIGFDYYPWGSFLVPLYPMIMTYAVLKFNLMDVRIFIRRAILLIGIYLVLLLITIPGIFALHHKTTLRGPGEQQYLVLEIVLTGLALSSGPFLYALFVRRNEYFHEHAVAGLAHELKSPLANIESAIEILNEMKRTGPAEIREREYMQMIERNTVRLHKFIEDLLISFPFKSGNTPLSRTTVELSSLIRQTLDEYQHEAASKNLKINFDCSTPVSVECDEVKIKQVFSNLISNAIKFTDQGSVTVCADRDQNHITVSVHDTGPGIHPQELPHIFDRFFRGEKGSRKGTGIGLTIAKAWVEAHGGKIWAESEGEGRGTTMRFTLPI